MEEHISRILKMLEEGKISASEAETLISALRADAKATAGTSTSTAGTQKQAESRSDAGTKPEEGRAKSFEFQWSQKKGFPLDLSGLGKQISDAVKKIDPERIVREARSGLSKSSRNWSVAFKGFTWFGDGEDGRPENTLGQPTARSSETQDFDLAPGSAVQVENNWGPIAVFGGADRVSLEVDREAWASTDEEARAKLQELRVEAGAHGGDGGPSRLEVRVSAPEGWRDGTVSLRLHVPESTPIKLATVFGDARVENTSASVEVHAISGAISLDSLKGDIHAEGISGEVRASNISGPLSIASKSGDLTAENLTRGGTVTGVSGDLRVINVEGGRLEAKSVSGDLLVQAAGRQQPIDITMESVSGHLKLENARGNISLKSVSGHVSAFGLDALTLQAQTVSGSLELAVETPFAGTLTANTVSGDVSLATPGASNFRFTISTQSGRLECAHEVNGSSRTDTLWSGTVGTGAGNVTIQTRSGDVRLDKPA